MKEKERNEETLGEISLTDEEKNFKFFSFVNSQHKLEMKVFGRSQRNKPRLFFSGFQNYGCVIPLTLLNAEQKNKLETGPTLLVWN